MELPGEMFLKAVEGDVDLFAFRFDFVPEGKAVEDGATQLVTEQENGDLIVEGYAAVWDGDDRQGENFAEGAFTRGIKAFLEGQAGFCYHHKHDKLLGRFLNLWQDEKGLGFKARVDGAIRQHPELGTYYEQIKNGSLRGMSVGGFFKRAANKIVDVDFTEISATPVPVHPGTSLSVIAGKALASDLKAEHVTVPDLPVDEIRDEDFMWLQESLDSIDRILDRLARRKQDESTNTSTETAP